MVNLDSLFMDNLVSIIVPVYNSSPYLRNMLNSILLQTYQNWELILVDDHSSDNSLEIIKGFQSKDDRIKLYVRDRLPKGAQTCRNMGFNYSKGDFVIFFDSDDLVANFCLEQRVYFLNLYKECDFLTFPAIGFMEKKYDLNSFINGIDRHMDILSCFLSRKIPFVVWNNIYRRKSIIDLNLFWDEEIFSFQDSDYNIQSILKGAKMKFIDTSIDYFWRMGGNQKSIHKQINKSLDHLYSHCRFFRKIASIPVICNTNKYNFYILNYALYFIKLCIIHNSYECFNSIISNRLIVSNNFFYIRLLLANFFLFGKTHNVYVCKGVFLLFFPIRQIFTFMSQILFEYESRKILKNKF